jgi:hypothetical protein
VLDVTVIILTGLTTFSWETGSSFPPQAATQKTTQVTVKIDRMKQGSGLFHLFAFTFPTSRLLLSGDWAADLERDPHTTIQARGRRFSDPIDCQHALDRFLYYSALCVSSLMDFVWANYH